MKHAFFLIVIISALLLAACNNKKNKNTDSALELSKAQTALVTQTDSTFRIKKDSLHKHYDSIIHKTKLTETQKDSIKQVKKESQMDLKLKENEILSTVLDAEQLTNYQQQKEKKQETVEEKTTKKMAKLKEEYSLTNDQITLIQPIVSKAETEKESIKKKYRLEGKEKKEEMKAGEKAAKDKVEAVFNQSLQKIFTPAQNEKLLLKLSEKKKKERNS